MRQEKSASKQQRLTTKTKQQQLNQYKQNATNQLQNQHKNNNTKKLGG